MSIKDKILLCFQSLDIIGRKPSMRINDQQRFTTLIGGLLSGFIYILIILSFLNFGQDIYFKQFPQVIFKNGLVVNTNEEIILNDESGSVSPVILLREENGAYLNNISKFAVSVNVKEEYFNSYETNITLKNTGVSLTRCKEEILPTTMRYTQQFLLFKDRFKLGYCLTSNLVSDQKLDHLAGLSLNNYFDNFSHSIYNKAVSINFVFPYNTSVNSVEILYNTIIRDESDHENFSKHIIKRFESPMVTLFNKKINIKITRATLNDDEGLVFTSYLAKNFAFVSEVSEIVSKLNENKKELEFELVLSLSSEKVEFFRKYLKVQTLLAAIGGITKALFIMAYCVNYFNNNTFYYEKMISEIFDIKDLRKNYQFYENKNKHIYKKFRNSIALRRTKDFEQLKKDLSNLSMPPKSNNYVTSNKLEHSGSQMNNNLPSSTQNGLKELNRVNEKNNSSNSISHVQDDINNDDYFKELNNVDNAVLDKKMHEQLKLNDNHHIINLDNLKSQNGRTNSRKPTMVISHDTLKLNKNFKNNFDKIKNEKFKLTFCDMIFLKLFCCCKNNNNIKFQKNILDSGRFLINNRLDVISLLKKFLDFDRFKNLVLKDHQLVLLNSLSKFLLDPETVNIVDFNNITFDKLIDALITANNSNSVIDYNLKQFVKIKYELDQHISE